MADVPDKPAAFRFVVLSDLHYLEEACRPWLEGLVREVNRTPYDLALILGDLAEHGSLAELSASKGIIDQLHMPYYCVPGNHDGPPNRPLGTGATGLTTYESLLPNRRNYWFVHKGWQFIGLDTTDGSGYECFPCTPETMDFARKAAAALDREAPTILFTHLPLFPKVRFSLGNGLELVEVFRPLNLRIVFSGHYHGLSENPIPNRPSVKLLTSRCSSRWREVHDGSGLRGYLTCAAKADGGVDHQFVEYKGPGGSR